MQQVETKTLISALLALAGIWLMLRQVPDYAATVYLIIVDSPDGSSLLVPTQSIRFIASLLCGAFLVLGRRPLADWLVPSSQVTEHQPQSLLSVGVAIVAVYFLLSGLVALGQHVAFSRIQNISDEYVLWQGVFSIGTGVLMFVASVGFARMWSRLRGR